MERKEHYRLHKSGKRWVAGIVATAAIGVPLALQTPVAQAADDSSSVTVTKTVQAASTLDQQKTALKTTLDNAFKTVGISWSGQANGAGGTLGTSFDDAKNSDQLNTVWQKAMANYVTAKIQKHLALPDSTSPANVTAINAFKVKNATVTNFTNLTNQKATDDLIATGNTPAGQEPQYQTALTKLDDFFTKTDLNKNKTALQDALTAGQWATLTAGSGSQAQTLSALVTGTTSSNELNTQWPTVANTVAAATAKKLLNASTDDAVAAFLKAKSQVTGYLNETNQQVIDAIVSAKKISTSVSFPDYKGALADITSYLDKAVKAQTNSAVATINVRDWTDGAIIAQRTITVKSGDTIPIGAAYHDGWTFDYVNLDGTKQDANNGTFTFSKTIKQDTTYTVDFHYKKATGNVEQAATGVVYVKNTEGAKLYTDKDLSKQIANRTLAVGTGWKYFTKVYDTKGDLVAYKVATNEYVKAADVQTTAVTDYVVQAFNGVLRIITDNTQTYSDVALTKPITGQALAYGSRWAAPQKILHDGKTTGFQIGINVYVRVGDVAVESSRPTFTDTSDVVYVQRSQAPQYVFDENTNQFTLAANLPRLQMTSPWQAHSKAVMQDGTVYYLVSSKGWVKGDDVTTARVTSRTGAVTVTNINGALTYRNPTKTGDAVQRLVTRSAWKIWAVAQNPDGSSAYLVADNQWVSANDVSEQIQDNTRGLFQVGDITAVTFDSNGRVIRGQFLNPNTRWQVTGRLTIGNQLFYRVATGVYVRSDFGMYVQ
ncbi:KxYKxGKxW signal peptide domain-containing protein [Schleiferilactobacillus shenzhenensis]|uniref:Uncharacterized protein n=1 Tax=Schleiferilactobacillus shenzhenensis LY-73 TaxID=1231336 RepID=U4TIA6_9LACO|nr:KxYKxGKxW signal peptide domain-containing protein [Schleiferilactobacillus shenzhenensis]ERL64536.1 hypothetical protein L248_0831 [Schleiferilactobacillus shenzhenensis LY-73]